MIVALPITDGEQNAVVSKRFARSSFFAVIDTEAKSVEYVENPYKTDTKRAGKSVVELLVGKFGVSCLVAFELGLKVQKLANSRDMLQIILHKENQSVTDILRMMKI